MLKGSVIANLDDGTAVKGVLLRHLTGGYIVMANAEVFDGDQSAPADGTIYIPRKRVSFIQKIG